MAEDKIEVMKYKLTLQLFRKKYECSLHTPHRRLEKPNLEKIGTSD